MYFLISLVYEIYEKDGTTVEYKSTCKRHSTHSLQDLSRELPILILHEQRVLAATTRVREKKLLVKLTSHSVAPYSV